MDVGPSGAESRTEVGVEIGAIDPVHAIAALCGLWRAPCLFAADCAECANPGIFALIRYLFRTWSVEPSELGFTRRVRDVAARRRSPAFIRRHPATGERL